MPQANRCLYEKWNCDQVSTKQLDRSTAVTPLKRTRISNVVTVLSLPLPNLQWCLQRKRKQTLPCT